MTSGNMSLVMREERAFYNAAGDPHVFPTDTFVGRAHDLAELRQAIVEAPGRLVTVLGPAGVGKTRLALEAMRTAGEHYPGGGLVVRLAAIERAGDIVPEIARAMGIIDQAEKLDAIVREELNGAPSVVLLDCYEHLTPAADAVLADLLASCPELCIVLTSRRPSGLPDDWRLELQPLAVSRPDATSSGPPSEAVQLFVVRARKANEHLRLRSEDEPVIEALCARYDGLPLAIELMASWVTVLSPRELLEWKPDQLESARPCSISATRACWTRSPGASDCSLPMRRRYSAAFLSFPVGSAEIKSSTSRADVPPGPDIHLPTGMTHAGHSISMGPEIQPCNRKIPTSHAACFP